jgi:mono/diheme cytochrome c family protein
MRSQRFALAVVLVVGSTAGAQSATTADLVFRARQILVKHCAECHGEKPAPSTLGVLDHAQLTRAKEPVSFVRAGDTSASQVIDLIEEGSMPPGDRAKVSPADAKILRAWIESGAKAFPIRFDDEFAYQTILADVKKLPAADLKKMRYLTLHHLAADGANADFKAVRAEFLAGVKSVIKKDAPGPEALDSAETVFRLDIEKSDWAHKRFTRVDDKTGDPTGDPLGNLYDVVLLEYPHGVVPHQSAAFSELVPLFLAKAEQVRPFAFVRGDWFVDTVTTAPLADDLHELMKRVVPVPPGLSAPKPPIARRTEPVAAAPDVVALPALDAWYGPDPAAQPGAPPGFTADTYHQSLNQVRRVFEDGGQLRLRYIADPETYFQYLWIDATNMITPSDVGRQRPKTQGEKTLPDTRRGLIFEGNGKEKFWVYASPHKFADGQLWRARSSKIERYVHPFFAFKQTDGKVIISTDDVKIVRKTIPIEITPKK